MKNTSKIDGGFQIYLKSTFESPIFFSYKVTNPSNSRKINFDNKLHFQSFLDGRREGILGFQFRERVIVATISTTKMIDFYLKWFHMIRVAQIRCFFFTLKVLKETDVSSG